MDLEGCLLRMTCHLLDDLRVFDDTKKIKKKTLVEDGAKSYDVKNKNFEIKKIKTDNKYIKYFEMFCVNKGA